MQRKMMTRAAMSVRLLKLPEQGAGVLTTITEPLGEGCAVVLDETVVSGIL